MTEAEADREDLEWNPEDEVVDEPPLLLLLLLVLGPVVSVLVLALALRSRVLLWALLSTPILPSLPTTPLEMSIVSFCEVVEDSSRVSPAWLLLGLDTLEGGESEV